MKNLNKIFETHEDTRKLYRRERVKYFKLFRAVMFLILFIGILYIGMALYYLEGWNSEQLNTIEIPTHYTAEINGRDTVISEYADDTREARVQFQYCEPLSWDKNKCRNQDEIISIKF